MWDESWLGTVALKRGKIDHAVSAYAGSWEVVLHGPGGRQGWTVGGCIVGGNRYRFLAGMVSYVVDTGCRVGDMYVCLKDGHC